MKSNKIIVALDGMTFTDAYIMAEKLSGMVWGFKIHTLLIEHGTSIIHYFKKLGNVFADLKFHDIPITVANHIKALYDADFLTVTVTSKNSKMLQTAMDAKSEHQKILGIVNLTSEEWVDIDDVYGKIWVANKCLDGIVYDGKICATSKIIVAAGVRPKWYESKDDHHQPSTPKQAIENGADYLVIGRPITLAPDPVIACQKIIEEIEKIS